MTDDSDEELNQRPVDDSHESEIRWDLSDLSAYKSSKSSHWSPQDLVDYDVDGALKSLNQRINSSLQEANKKIDTITAETDAKLTSALKDVSDQTEKFRDQVDDSKTRIVETLGLFVAFFTFLSIQVQVFKDTALKKTNTLGLILVTAGLLIFFVLVMDLIIKTQRDINTFAKWRFGILFASSIAMIAAGYLLFKGG